MLNVESEYIDPYTLSDKKIQGKTVIQNIYIENSKFISASGRNSRANSRNHRRSINTQNTNSANKYFNHIENSNELSTQFQNTIKGIKSSVDATNYFDRRNSHGFEGSWKL